MVSPTALIVSSFAAGSAVHTRFHSRSMVGPPKTLFKCTCMCEFTQASAYTKHQHSCMKGKKQLLSALSKAKDLLGSVKWSRLSANSCRQDVCASTASSSPQVCCPQIPSLSSDQPINAEVSQTSLTITPGEMSHSDSSLQADAQTSMSDI